MQLLQERGRLREGHGELDVLLARAAGEIAESRVLQQAVAEPLAVPPPVPRDDGHAHVQRLARRTAARIGVGVEHDIHIVVPLQIVPRRILQRKLPGLESRGEHTPPHDLHEARLVAGILDEEMAARHAPQDLEPVRQHLIRDLEVVVETRKDDGIMRPVGLPLIAQHARGWRIAEMRMRQADHLLREVLVVQAGWVAVDIPEEIVDGLRPGRAHIADARDLHGRRPVAHDHHRAPARRVDIEVKQDIDFIVIDDLCDLTHRHIAREKPHDLDMLAQHIRELILDLPQAVGVDLKLVRLVRREQLQGKIAHDVLREFPREVADAELFMLMPCEGMREMMHSLRERIVEEMQLAHLPVADVGEIMHHKEVIAEIPLLDTKRLPLRGLDAAPGILTPCPQVGHLVVARRIVFVDAPERIFRHVPLAHEELQFFQGHARLFFEQQFLDGQQPRVDFSEFHDLFPFLSHAGVPGTSPRRRTPLLYYMFRYS